MLYVFQIFSVASMVITLISIFTFVAETHYLFQQIKLSNGTLLPAPPPVPMAVPRCCETRVLHVTNHSADGNYNTTHDESGNFLIV